MFNYFDYFDKGFIFGIPTDKYNPYINYSWSQTLTVSNTQQIKDTGTAGLNLQQFFGQGCWFNGIDMQITIPVNATIQTEIKRVDGVTEINTNTQVLNNYNVYSGSGAKVYKDLYMFNRALTSIEIEKYNDNPNQFFMDSLEDSSCVLAMPMCEKDGFVRNYKNYSKLEKVVNKENVILSSSHSNTRIAQQNIGTLIEAGRTYEIVYDFLPNANFVEFKLGIIFTINNNISYYVIIPISDFSGKCIYSVPNMGVLSSCYMWIGVNGTSTTHTFKEISVKQLTGIYPITNYLTTCRTNAQRLSYGLQTSGFKRDSNGLILSKSNFLETDDIGYGATGWIPKWNEDFTAETIFEVSNDSEFRLNGNSYSAGVYFGKNSGGKKLYIRVFGSSAIQIANTKDTVCLTFSYNWQTKEVKQYLDGVLVTTQLAIATINVATPVLLGMAALSGSNYPTIKPVRLFKIHSKVLTQTEITKNYTKYQTQGLLNE